MLLVSCSGRGPDASSESRPDDARDEFRIAVTGDMILVEPWSEYNEPQFLELITFIRSAEVSIANLEMLVHDYEGYPQIESGGSYLRAPPSIVESLKWAGIDMVANANNHSFDYGAIGVITTIDHVRNGGIQIAGVGENLQEARKARFFKSGSTIVSLVSITTSYPYFGRASPARANSRGRPGLNPIEVNDRSRMNFADLEENLKTISRASLVSDYTVVSVHSHQEGSTEELPPEFLVTLSELAIDNGADIFFVHGPHKLKGIRFYKNRVIFYSLGNLVLQADLITTQPWEYFRRYNLNDSASLDEVYEARLLDPDYYLNDDRSWIGVVPHAVFDANTKSIREVRLLPLVIQRDKDQPSYGRPFAAHGPRATEIINELGRLSMPYLTQVSFDAESEMGKALERHELTESEMR